MRRVLLDTDILSEILKGRDLLVVRRAVAYAEEHGRFTYTAVSIHEILFGLHYRDATSQLRHAEVCFNENEVILPVLEDYTTAGRVRGQARRQGRQLTLDDCLIGSVAQRLGLPVATGNAGHFEAMRLAGLSIELENWRQP